MKLMVWSLVLFVGGCGGGAANDAQDGGLAEAAGVDSAAGDEGNPDADGTDADGGLDMEGAADSLVSGDVAVSDVATFTQDSGAMGCPPSLPSGTCSLPLNGQQQGCSYGTTCCSCNGGLPGPFSWQCALLGTQSAGCPPSVPTRGEPCTQPLACSYCAPGGMGPGGILVIDCNGTSWQ